MKRLLLLALIVFVPSAFAAEQQPAYMQPEVIKAAVAMNLTDDQKPQFQTAVGALFDGRMKAFNKLMRRNNQSNIDRKMKSKTNALLKQMDEDMAAFLTDAQMPAYQNYRDTLKSHMRGM